MLEKKISLYDQIDWASNTYEIVGDYNEPQENEFVEAAVVYHPHLVYAYKYSCDRGVMTTCVCSGMSKAENKCECQQVEDTYMYWTWSQLRNSIIIVVIIVRIIISECRYKISQEKH